jgi:protocatechuate 3,4-dioxygenase beta subunit
LNVVDVNTACTPLIGYAVYLWHCDPLGQYSLYDQPNESWLRGVQVTDANSQVTFTTVFPGCYAGRFPHIHFEIFSSPANATSGRYARLVSQLAMPVEACNAVYADTTIYGASRTRFATSRRGKNSPPDWAGRITKRSIALSILPSAVCGGNWRCTIRRSLFGRCEVKAMA